MTITVYKNKAIGDVMKNTFGNNISITLFGESHGEYIGAVLDGVCAGIKVDEEYIESKLEKRKPHGAISTKRREPDKVEIVSGVYNGVPTTSFIMSMRRSISLSK